MMNAPFPELLIRKLIPAISILLMVVMMNAQTPNEIIGQQLDALIAIELQQQPIPGLSACIVKNGKVVWKTAQGLANINLNEPVTTQTEFTLASISKLFTATAVAQLWENGLLDIDADINNYLPISVINPNFPNVPITARQLLLHKSSLKDFESDLELWDAPGDPIYSLPNFCSQYFVAGGSLYKASNWASTAPGNSGYWYSNAGFTLLGYLVESISGTPFNVYVKTNILQPLNMPSAGWYYSEVDSAGMAMPYDNSLQPYGFYSVPEYPSAMLKSNVEELANFLIAYTLEGQFNGVQLVTPATFQTIVPSTMTNGFGWWGKDTWYGDPTGNFWSHGGFMNGVRTQLNYYPADSTGLIILTNGEGSYAAIEQLVESYIPLFETDMISGLAEVATLSFSMAPNPANDQVRIHFDEKAQFPVEVRLLDASGRVLLTETFEKEIVIPTASYPKGCYLIHLASKYGSGTKLLTIVRKE